jgi:hypothetical protein
MTVLLEHMPEGECCYLCEDVCWLFVFGWFQDLRLSTQTPSISGEGVLFS